MIMKKTMKELLEFIEETVLIRKELISNNLFKFCIKLLFVKNLKKIS